MNRDAAGPWIKSSFDPAVASSAGVATTVGSASGNPTENTIFCIGEKACTFYSQSTGGQPAAIVPANGVIVSWRFNSGSVGYAAALQVLRPVGANFTGAGTSSEVTITSLGLREYPTRLQVKAGDVLGLRNAKDGLFMEEDSAGPSVGAFEPPLADGQDGCPSNPQAQTSGCPATAQSPATPGIQANLSFSPNPTCTGARTRFDMSGSTTPNPPITNYRLTYKVLPFPVYVGTAVNLGLAAGFGVITGSTTLFNQPTTFEIAIDKYLVTQSSAYLYEGPDSARAFDFTWNRQVRGSQYQELESGLIGANIDAYARDPIVVTLTVGDRTGATASVKRLPEFAQVYSSGRLGASRSGCPKVRVLVPPYPFARVLGVSLSANTVAVKIPCATSSSCAGKFLACRTGTASASGAAPSVVGAAKAMPDKPVRAAIRLTSISSATGRATTHTIHVMLAGLKPK